MYEAMKNLQQDTVGFYFIFFLFVRHDLQRDPCLVAPRDSHLNASQTPGSGRAAAVRRTVQKITVFLGDEPVVE